MLIVLQGVCTGDRLYCASIYEKGCAQHIDRQTEAGEVKPRITTAK